MRLQLKSVSHPKIGTIEVKYYPFAIGRGEEPFQTFKTKYPDVPVDRLSRRHARIFTENGHLLVTDLGSLNGTTLNNISVGQKPLQIKDRDRLCLGKHLEFSVQLISEEIVEPDSGVLTSLTSIASGDHTRGTTANTGTPVLILDPLNPDLLQIEIPYFPFLVSRCDGPFPRAAKKNQDLIKRISRRHAQFFSREGSVFIEDLESKSGTFLNGRKLDEKAHKLEAGDKVKFGDKVIFRVSYRSSAPTRAPMKPSNDENDSCIEFANTIHITRAGSFLDIFCPESESDGEALKISEESQAEINPKSAQSRKRNSRFKRNLKELREASQDADERGFPVGRFFLLLILLSSIGVGFLLHFRGEELRTLRALIDTGRIKEAVQFSEALASAGQRRDNLADLQKKAVLQYLVPQLIQAFDQNQFKEAISLTEEAQTTFPNLEAVFGFGEAFTFLARIEKFSQSRSQNGSIQLFEDEETIRSLVSEWSRNRHQYQRRFERVAETYPAFNQLLKLFYSRMGEIRRDHDVYLPAIRQLISESAENAGNADWERLSYEIERFEKEFSRVRGLDKLLVDIEVYRNTREKLDQNLPIAAALLARGHAMSSKEFASLIGNLSSQMPPEHFVAAFEEAREEWRKGRTSSAITKMASLETGQWSAAAQEERTRMQKIQETFEVLFGANAPDPRPREIIVFANLLLEDPDQFFIQHIESKIAKATETIRTEAGSFADRSRRIFLSYERSGKITPQMRSSALFTPEYKLRVAELTEAWDLIVKATGDFQLISEPVENEVRLYKEIRNEILEQRERLEILHDIQPQSRDSLRKMIQSLPIVD